jgi:hypothetical protein
MGVAVTSAGGEGREGKASDVAVNQRTLANWRLPPLTVRRRETGWNLGEFS